MPPKLRSDDGRNVVIRPLILCDEQELARFATERRFPVVPCDQCWSQEHLQRSEVKRMLADWTTRNPNLKSTIMAAIGNGRRASSTRPPPPGAARATGSSRTETTGSSGRSRSGSGSPGPRIGHDPRGPALHRGLRIGQVCGIRWRDVDVTRRTLTVVVGKSRREKADRRTVPITTDVANLLGTRSGGPDARRSGVCLPTRPAAHHQPRRGSPAARGGGGREGDPVGDLGLRGPEDQGQWRT